MLDEHKAEAARGYKTRFAEIATMLLLFGVAYYADTKWVVASGFTLLIYSVLAYDGRLHDLCVRLRRTNLLLAEIQEAVEKQNDLALWKG